MRRAPVDLHGPPHQPAEEERSGDRGDGEEDSRLPRLHHLLQIHPETQPDHRRLQQQLRRLRRPLPEWIPDRQRQHQAQRQRDRRRCPRRDTE